MPRRTVHAGVVPVGFRDNLEDLLKRFVYNAYLLEKEGRYLNTHTSADGEIDTSEMMESSDDAFKALTGFKNKNEIKTELIKYLKKPKTDKPEDKWALWDLFAIKKIRGMRWNLPQKNNMTNGVLFIYLTRKSIIDITKCIQECEKHIKGSIDDLRRQKAILTLFTQEDYKLLKEYLEDIKENYLGMNDDHAINAGKLIAAVRIHDALELNEIDVNGKTSKVAFARLDPTFKQMLFFKKPIDHADLKTIKYDITDENPDGTNFGIFSGVSKALDDEVANAINEKYITHDSQSNWLQDTVFGDTSYDNLKINSDNWLSKMSWRDAKGNDMFSQETEDGRVDLIEEDVKSYFLNYLVDDFTNQGNIYRHTEVRTCDKLTGKLRWKADYVLPVVRPGKTYWIPLEAKSDISIGAGKKVLEQIHKYANLPKFTHLLYDFNSNQFIDKEVDTITGNTTSQAKTHGLVLIGDKHGIHLAFVRADHASGFVFQKKGNASTYERVMWKREKLTEKVMDEMRKSMLKYIEFFMNEPDAFLRKPEVRDNEDNTYILHNELEPKSIDPQTAQITPSTLTTIISATKSRLTPYAGGNADLMHNVASLADEINSLPKIVSPIETLSLCVPMGNNVYLTSIYGIWFPVHVKYTNTPNSNYTEYLYGNQYKEFSAVIPVGQPHGISLVASTQGLDIMYNGKIDKKIPITQARDTIWEYYKNKQQASTN